MKYPNRLFELRGKESQAEMAARIGMTQQNYANYESGKSGMKSDMIAAVCKEFGCTAEWLLCMSNSKDGAPSKDMVEVPLYGSIAAGTPIEMMAVEDSHPVPAEVRRRYPSAFLLKVEGDSMSRILPNGCYALVDPCATVEHNGAPYAVCVNGYDATIKRVNRLNNGFELVPDSTDPTYSKQVFNYNEPGTQTITVIGEVVYFVLPFDWHF